MRGTSFVVTIIFIAVSLVGQSVFAQMLGPRFSPAEQLVVLKNGEILRGRVTRNAEQVIVHTEQGSRLVLPADRTEFVCDSMEDAYWGKVARTRATDVEGQIRLFHWCLKNQLTVHAQNQIDILLQTEITATDLENLDRQLNVALIQVRSAVQRLANAEKAQAIQVDSFDDTESESANLFHQQDQVIIALDNSIGNGVLIGQTGSRSNQFDPTVFRKLPALAPATATSNNSEFAELPPMRPGDAIESSPDSVRQVGFEEEVFETISPIHRKPSKGSLKFSSQFDLPGNEQVDDRIMIPIPEMERELKSLPKGVTGYYRSRVERSLTYGCSAAKCHDSDSRAMPLLHLGRSQAIPRMQSQRNLHNVLKYVDRTDPFESRIFLAATQPHAGGETPVFNPQGNRVENLKAWLLMLSDDPRAAAIKEMQRQQELVNVAIGSMDNPLVPVKPQPMGLAPVEASSLKFPETIGEIPKLNAGEKVFIPIDPFDPEIFNRKFHK